MRSIVRLVVSNPRRIQRRRVKGWRMPPGARYVGRGSRWGNIYIVGESYQDNAGEWHVVRDEEHAVALYREWVTPHQCIIAEELSGTDLACWCAEDAPWCHADVLLELANAP